MDIRKILKQHNFSDNVINVLIEFLDIQELRKNDYFIKYGERMDFIGILAEGSLVSRYANESGVEVASKFYTLRTDFIVVDYFCFKNKLNSTECIQAVEETKVLTLSREIFEKLLVEHPEFRELVNQLLEGNYLKSLSRVRDFQFLNAAERVAKFLQVHGNDINKFQVGDKASYLGLSRNIFTTKMKEL